MRGATCPVSPTGAGGSPAEKGRAQTDGDPEKGPDNRESHPKRRLVAPRFSDCASAAFDVVKAAVIGHTADTVGFEVVSAGVEGPLRGYVPARN